MTRKLAVIDAETDPFKTGRIPRPFLWGYRDADTFLTFADTAALVDHAKEANAIIYAHNGGRFDFHFLLPWFEPYDAIQLINGRIARASFGTSELRDSYCIIPVPLAAYRKDDFDYARMEADARHKSGNWAAIVKYLQHDCDYLYELITRFVDTFGLHLTQAGAGMAQWEKIHGEHAPRSDGAFYADFRDYYYGGRVECFESGIIDTEFTVHDITSAYPFAMLSKHPYSLTYDVQSEYVPDADFYRIECASRGAFPYRGKEGLEFPNDGARREFFITGHEYRMAGDWNALIGARVLESRTFTRHVSFRPYVEKFHAMRQTAKVAKDDAASLFAKLLMNSLYGKFGANPDEYRNYLLVPPEDAADIDGSGWDFAGQLGPWIVAEHELNDSERRFYNVATAASITGYVRAMMYDAIRRSKGVMYCDTDALAARTFGGVPIGDGLGQWGLKGHFDRAGIGGKKLYIFRGTRDDAGKRVNLRASKGVRLTDAQLWQVAAGGTVDYVSEAPSFSMVAAPGFIERTITRTGA